jgi:hypothetical protein
VNVLDLVAPIWDADMSNAMTQLRGTSNTVFLEAYSIMRRGNMEYAPNMEYRDIGETKCDNTVINRHVES